MAGRLHLPPAAMPTQRGNMRRPGADLTAPRTPCQVSTTTSAGLARERWPFAVQVEHGENCKVGKTSAGRW